MIEEATVIRRVPIVAVRGSVIFPHTDTLLSFGRPKSTAAINTAFQEDRVIAIFTQKDARTSDPMEEDLYKVGTIATITQMMSTEGEIHALVRGQARIKIEEIISSEPYLLGKVIELKEEEGEADEVKALASQLADLFKKAINLGKQAEIMAVMRLISGPVEPMELVDQVAALLEVKTVEKQKLLETLSVKKRMQRVLELIAKEVNILDLERTISSKTQQRFEDQMRKAMLREKKRTIEEELGEEEGELSSDEAKEYKEKIVEAKMPKDVREKAEKELKKLIQLSPHNPEGGYIRNYLDWLVDMPWAKLTPNNVSIKNAAKILEDRHDGMKKPKERILAIAHNLGWNLTPNTSPEIHYEFTLDFTDYIKNTTHLRDKKWKLVNRLLTKGRVYLTKNETARLLSEEVRKHIEKKLETKDLPRLPPKITEIAEKIKKLADEKIGKTEMEGFPKIISQTAFPPCINALYAAFSSGRHLSHIGRFTLTSFLVSIGMSPENVITLFKNISDFNERMTRYQVEHIAGDRGSRTRYKPPKCDTLQTHGVCIDPDNLCKRIHHPLTYYKMKLKKTK